MVGLHASGEGVMVVNADYMRDVFLALIAVGPGIAPVAYLVGTFHDQRDEQKQQLRQRAGEFRQNKRRLRIR